MLRGPGRLWDRLVAGHTTEAGAPARAAPPAVPTLSGAARGPRFLSQASRCGGLPLAHTDPLLMEPMVGVLRADPGAGQVQAGFWEAGLGAVQCPALRASGARPPAVHPEMLGSGQ